MKYGFHTRSYNCKKGTSYTKDEEKPPRTALKKKIRSYIFFEIQSPILSENHGEN